MNISFTSSQIAKLRILVDGGGNRWDKIKTTFPDISYPHIVSGDFDSIRPHVLEQFKQQNEIRIIETLNQDETDFTKALRILQEELSSLPQTQVNNLYLRNTHVCNLMGMKNGFEWTILNTCVPIRLHKLWHIANPLGGLIRSWRILRHFFTP